MPLIAHCADSGKTKWNEIAPREFCLIKEGLRVFMDDYVMEQTNREG